MVQLVEKIQRKSSVVPQPDMQAKIGQEYETITIFASNYILHIYHDRKCLSDVELHGM